MDSHMELKKCLAWAIVGMLEGFDKADEAQAEWENIHQNGGVPNAMPEIHGGTLLSVVARIREF